MGSLWDLLGFDGRILGKSALWGCFFQRTATRHGGNGLQWTHRNPTGSSHTAILNKNRTILGGSSQLVVCNPTYFPRVFVGFNPIDGIRR